MHIYEKEFDFVIQRAKSLERPARMVVAGADCENILKAVFEAEAQGFCEPILVGYKDRILAVLKELGLQDRKYVLSDVTGVELPDLGTDYHIYMKRAISIINDGLGDILVRGNTSTRNFLMPILDKKNGLVDGLVCEVALLKVPYYDKVMALSDVSVLINPSEGQRKKVTAADDKAFAHLCPAKGAGSSQSPLCVVLCRFPMNAAFCSWLQRDNDIQACGLNDIFAFGKNDIALRATIFTLRVNSRISL